MAFAVKLTVLKTSTRVGHIISLVKDEMKIYTVEEDEEIHCMYIFYYTLECYIIGYDIKYTIL